MFWSVTVSLIPCNSTHEPYAQHELVTNLLMNSSSNRNLKHVGYDSWNMCYAHVTLSGGYVSSLSTSSEGGPSGWSCADTVHSASGELDKGQSLQRPCPCLFPTSPIADLPSCPVWNVRSKRRLTSQGIPKMHQTQLLGLHKDVSSWWF